MWVGEVPADCVVRIGSLVLTAPERPGPLTVDLTLTAGDTVVATNRHETRIDPP